MSDSRHRRGVFQTFAIASAVLLSLGSVVPTASAAPAEWESHWIQNIPRDRDTQDGVRDGIIVGHDNSRGLCGGFVGPDYGGSENWLVIHAHRAPTFTVSPAGGLLTFQWKAHANDGGFANRANTAVLYLELEHDYTTNEHFPDEATRPRYFEVTMSRSEFQPQQVSVDLSARAGHHIKLQFRCVQFGIPVTAGGFSANGTEYTLHNISLPI
jgi:hypothetical protein